MKLLPLKMTGTNSVVEPVGRRSIWVLTLRDTVTGALNELLPPSDATVPGKVWLATTCPPMSTSSRDSCTSPALTFAVTSIWQRTLVSTTGSEGAPAIGVQVPAVVGTQVTLAMLTVAGVGICSVTAEKPQ